MFAPRKVLLRRNLMIATSAAALTLLGAVVVSAAGPAATFSTMTTYTVGSAPREVVVGDLNADGKADAVSADSTSNRISVLLGKGDGTFDTSYSAATVTGARSVALGDMNKDGNVDIVASGSSLAVQVLTSSGGSTPTFTATSYTMASGTAGQRTVVVADFNADSWLDMAVSAFAANKVGVRLNNGSGGFNAFSEYATGTGPTGLAAGDFNGDSVPDLVSFNRTGTSATSTATVLLNNGSGVFTATNLGVGAGPDFGAAGDLNGDGKAEFVAANTISTAGLTVGVNNGSGVFAKGTTYAMPTGASIAEGAALADVNLDGNLDALVATNATGFAVYYGNGDGTFAAGVLIATSSSMPYGLAAADVNGDSKPDVLLTGANGSPSNAIGVLLNTTVTAPGAPTALTAIPGDRSAEISFTAPAGTVTNYEYSLDGGPWTAFSPAAATSPVTVTGLSNTITYQVRLRAVNSVGSGTASSAVSVTPSGKPSAPQSPTVTGGALTWSAPNWASTPTAYVVMYKRWSDRDNPSVPWGIYASRGSAPSATFSPGFAVPSQVQLDATRRACGPTNTAAGWANCPLPHGFASVTGGYAMRVYATNGAVAGSVSSTVQVTP